MISAVIFDCDGVLVDSEVLAHEVEIDVLGAAGLHYDAQEFRTRFMGLSDKAFFEALEADGLKRLGRSVISEIREPLELRYAQAMEERLVEIPHALRAIQSVAQAKAVASSSTKLRLKLKLQKVGHWDHFAPHIYSAEAVARSKPAPDLFLYAADALGIDPAHCLVIEDSENGIQAAKAAGMRVWGFVGGSHNDKRSCEAVSNAGVERVIDDWRQAVPLLAAL